MSARTAARQYANALFDVAAASGRIDPIQRDLARLAATVASHDELQRVLGDRTVPSATRAAILGAVIEHMGGIADEVDRLLRWLLNRDRLPLLPDIDAAFSARVLDVGRTVHAEITTIAALDDGARASLRQALGHALGRDVLMTERVDPAIVGGLIAKVGTVVFDGSITRHIERFRETLLAGR